jgi:hypothetical protein
MRGVAMGILGVNCQGSPTLERVPTTNCGM